MEGWPSGLRQRSAKPPGALIPNSSDVPVKVRSGEAEIYHPVGSNPTPSARCSSAREDNKYLIPRQQFRSIKIINAFRNVPSIVI